MSYKNWKASRRRLRAKQTKLSFAMEKASKDGLNKRAAKLFRNRENLKKEMVMMTRDKISAAKVTQGLCAYQDVAARLHKRKRSTNISQATKIAAMWQEE